MKLLAFIDYLVRAIVDNAIKAQCINQNVINYEIGVVTIKKLELPNIVDHRIPPYVYVSRTSIRGKE